MNTQTESMVVRIATYFIVQKVIDGIELGKTIRKGSSKPTLEALGDSIVRVCKGTKRVLTGKISPQAKVEPKATIPSDIENTMKLINWEEE